MTHVQRDITWRVYPAEGKAVLLGTVRGETQEIAQEYADKRRYQWKSSDGEKHQGAVRLQV